MVVNFGVVTYSREVYGDWIEGKVGDRPADEYEFELIVPRDWVAMKVKQFSMKKGDNESYGRF